MIHKNWQELIKPTQLEVKPGNDPERQATVVAEPLERGFGLTLGNALRRVLMSSLQGAAITSVQIDNVLHEFSSVAGVREDVTDIVLNLKGVAIRMDVEGPKRLSISVKGPQVVTAGDIFANAGDAGEFVQDVVDLHRGDGRALQRAHQNATQRVAQSQTKATLQRLGNQSCLTCGIVTRLAVKLGRLDQFCPILMDHVIPPFLSAPHDQQGADARGSK